MYSSTTIVGNLSKDIALTYVPSGTAVAKTSIAYSDGFGENKKTHFIDVVVWGKTAEAFSNYCKKGSKVLLVGVVQFEQWTAQDGSSRSRHSLRVEEMKMLDSKGSNEGSSYGNNSYNQVPKEQYNEPSYNPNQGAGRVAQSRVEQNIPEIDIDDEIPF